MVATKQQSRGSELEPAGAAPIFCTGRLKCSALASILELEPNIVALRGRFGSTVRASCMMQLGRMCLDGMQGKSSCIKRL